MALRLGLAVGVAPGRLVRYVVRARLDLRVTETASDRGAESGRTLETKT